MVEANVTTWPQAHTRFFSKYNWRSPRVALGIQGVIMPTVKIQDSDGKEKALIGKAVLGVSTNGKEYVANMVCQELSGIFDVVKATLTYFNDKYPEDFELASRNLNIPVNQIICAAVVAEDGEIFVGRRHADCIRSIKEAGKKPGTDPNAQGFIDSFNVYCTREEARQIQDAARIPSKNKDGYMPGTLFSEDLY